MSSRNLFIIMLICAALSGCKSGSSTPAPSAPAKATPPKDHTPPPPPAPETPPQPVTPTTPPTPVIEPLNIGNITVPRADNPAGFKVEVGNLTLFTISLYHDISKANYQLTGPGQVDAAKSVHQIREEHVQPGTGADQTEYSDTGVTFSDNKSYMRFDFKTETFADLVMYTKSSGYPYLDPATGDIWQFNLNGTVKQNDKTIKMPPLTSPDLRLELTQFGPLQAFAFDPKAHVLLWRGYDCSQINGDCLNNSPPSGALIWDLDRKKAIGPLLLKAGQSENKLGWMVDTVPEQREFALFGLSDKCLKLRMISYAGVDRALPVTNSALGAVCNVRSSFNGYGEIALHHFGNQGLVILAFNDKVLVVDTQNDKVVRTIPLNPTMGVGDNIVTGKILFAQNDPSVFAVGILKKALPPAQPWDTIVQLQVFRLPQ